MKAKLRYIAPFYIDEYRYTENLADALCEDLEDQFDTLESILTYIDSMTFEELLEAAKGIAISVYEERWFDDLDDGTQISLIKFAQKRIVPYLRELYRGGEW